LPARQVGVALQMAVIDVSSSEDRPSAMWVNGQPVNLGDYMPMVLINPVVELGQEKEAGTEGCSLRPQDAHGYYSFGEGALQNDFARWSGAGFRGDGAFVPALCSTRWIISMACCLSTAWFRAKAAWAGKTQAVAGKPGSNNLAP